MPRGKGLGGTERLQSLKVFIASVVESLLNFFHDSLKPGADCHLQSLRSGSSAISIAV
jgi:hypothetical protein